MKEPIAPDGVLPGAHDVLVSRGVRPFLAMVFAASTGAALQSVAVGALVWDITERPLYLGLVGLAEFVPSALLVFVTGSVADRLDRRRIVLTCLTAELLVLLGLAAFAATEPTSVGPVFGLVVAYGAARAFLAPAQRSLPAAVAPPGGLARLMAFFSTAWQAAGIGGPAIGGFLYKAEPALAFEVAAAFVVLAIVAGIVLRARPTERAADADDRPSFHAAVEGLRLVRRTPILFAAISLDLFAVLFGGAVALIPAIADRLGGGPAEQGLLRAAGSAGAVVCAVFLATRPFDRRVGKRLLVAVAVFGAATVVLGATRTFWVAMLAMAVLSGADMISVFVRSTLVPLATPDGTRGRVLAVEQVFIGASNELGAFQSGVAAAILGTAWAVVAGGMATLAVVAIWWVRFPVLRDVDRFTDVERQE